jgi:hypothetical protein
LIQNVRIDPIALEDSGIWLTFSGLFRF